MNVDFFAGFLVGWLCCYVLGTIERVAKAVLERGNRDE